MKVPSHDLDVFLFFSYFLIFAPPSSVGMRGSLSPLSLPSPCPQSVLFCFCFSLSPVSGRGNETKRIVTFFYLLCLHVPYISYIITYIPGVSRTSLNPRSVHRSVSTAQQSTSEGGLLFPLSPGRPFDSQLSQRHPRRVRGVGSCCILR